MPRGRAVTLLGLTSNVGPLIGPIISGFTSTLDWRWQFWTALIIAAVNWPMLLLMPGELLLPSALRLTLPPSYYGHQSATHVMMGHVQSHDIMLDI